MHTTGKAIRPLFANLVTQSIICFITLSYEQDNWKKRSRGFVQDWAEGEPDDDPTKNYPFPVPRIREVPDELCNSTDADDPNPAIVVSNTTDQSSNVSEILDDANPDVIISNGSNKAQKNSSGHTLSPHYSGSLPAHLSNKVHVSQLTQRRAYSQIKHPTNRTTYRSRHYFDIKSTARKPSNASEKEIARARSIIQHRNSMLQE